MATFGAEVTGEAAEDDRIPFSRFIRPAAGMATEGGFPDDPEAYLGYRSLTEEEIDELANLLVDQITQRGPFFSVADFVNRAAVEDAPREHQLRGALQAAIDGTDINKTFTGSRKSITTRYVGKIYEKDSYAGDIAAGVPGYLEQGDVLARIGHLLSARSDTFVIRAYGSATRPDGSIAAEAWCEATVQRLPEYVSPADESAVAHADLTHNVNSAFGRRFIITSFRWLPSATLKS